MESYFKPIDWVVLIGYFAGTMGIGAYFYRRSRSTEQFTAAGRSLPGWVCGLSIFATFLSSISYLALPGKSFVDNWNPFAFSLALPLATWIGVTWFVSYYRKSGEVSAYALLERRFGTWARIYASLFYLLTQIARMGVVMYLMALPMAVIFGWDIRLVIVLTGVCVTIYSFIGGVVAVLYVPVSALFFLIGTALFVYYQAHADEIPEVKQLVARQRIMQSDGFEQLSGTEYQRQVVQTAGGITNSDIGDRVFPHFIAKHLPPGVTGLLIAAIFAAAMSTVSTSLNSSATLLLDDYYRRFFRPQAGEAESMRVLYGGTILWGILGTAMALALVPRTESALDTWWVLSSLFSGGMVGLFLLGMMSKRTGNAAALAAVGMGTLVLAWMAFSPLYWGRVDSQTELAPNSQSELVSQRDLAPILAPGDSVYVHYQWVDTALDIRKSAVDRREVESVAGDRLVLASPLKHTPAAALKLYRDNAWYRWRSPFNNLLAIVFGSLTILVVGVSLQWLIDRRHIA